MPQRCPELAQGAALPRHRPWGRTSRSGLNGNAGSPECALALPRQVLAGHAVHGVDVLARAHAESGSSSNTRRLWVENRQSGIPTPALPWTAPGDPCLPGTACRRCPLTRTSQSAAAVPADSGVIGLNGGQYHLLALLSSLLPLLPALALHNGLDDVRRAHGLCRCAARQPTAQQDREISTGQAVRPHQTPERWRQAPARPAGTAAGWPA